MINGVRQTLTFGRYAVATLCCLSLSLQPRFQSELKGTSLMFHDGGTLSLYKNPQLIKSAQISLTNAASIVQIAPPGPWAEDNKLNGKIAGVTIRAKALEPDQISAIGVKTPTN